MKDSTSNLSYVRQIPTEGIRVQNEHWKHMSTATVGRQYANWALFDDKCDYFLYRNSLVDCIKKEAKLFT
jgi:hypothetical protein